MRCEICGQDFEYTKLKNVSGRAFCVECYAARQFQKSQRNPSEPKSSAEPKPPIAASTVVKNIVVSLMILGLIGLVGFQFLPTGAQRRLLEPAPAAPPPQPRNDRDIADAFSFSGKDAPANTNASGRVTGEAWLQMPNGSIFPIAGDKVILVPLSVPIDANDKKFQAAAQELAARREKYERKAGVRLRLSQLPFSMVMPYIEEATASRSISAMKLVNLSRILILSDPLLNSMNADGPIDSNEMQVALDTEGFWQCLQRAARRTATADREGRFSFEKVEPGYYAVVCRGFRTGIRKVFYWKEPVDLTSQSEARVQLNTNNALITDFSDFGR